MISRRELEQEEWQTQIESRDRWLLTLYSVFGIAGALNLYYLGETRPNFWFSGVLSVYSGRWAVLAFQDWRKHWKVVRG